MRYKTTTLITFDNESRENNHIIMENISETNKITKEDQVDMWWFRRELQIRVIRRTRVAWNCCWNGQEFV